jgi:hypothetical protein
MPVAISSAASFERIEKQFLPELTTSAKLSNFYIFPDSSAQCLVYRDSDWYEEYRFELTREEHVIITQAIEEAVVETEILGTDRKYEPLVIDRTVEIAFAALGFNATEEDKNNWDPDQAKRKKLRDALMQRIPQFEILIGGKTTIDITRKGINKAYGVQWLATRLSVSPADMLYVGDALYEGGNDAVVIPTGIRTHQVSGPDETAKVIDELLVTCTALA